MNNALCITEKLKVKDLLSQLIKDGIDFKLDYLIHQYNNNIDKHQEKSESNVKIRKILGLKNSKSYVHFDIDNDINNFFPNLNEVYVPVKEKIDDVYESDARRNSM